MLNAMQTARRMANMSLRDVADALNVSTQTVWNWEHDRTPITMRSFIKYCSAVGCRPMDIFLLCESTGSLIC